MKVNKLFYNIKSSLKLLNRKINTFFLKKKSHVLFLFFAVFISLFETSVYLCGSQTTFAKSEFFSEQTALLADAESDKKGFIVYEDDQNPIFETPSQYWYYWRTIFDIAGKGLEYVPTVNAAKKDKIFLFEDESEELNITFLYSESYYSTEIEPFHRDGIFGLTLVDYGTRYYPNAYSYIYLSESQAKRILNNNQATIEDYKSLIGTSIDIYVNSVGKPWIIGNVFLEDEIFYKYHNLLGEFALTCNKKIDDLKREATFTLSNKAFINEYKVDHVRESFKNLSNIDTTYNFGENREVFLSNLLTVFLLKDSINVLPILGFTFSFILCYIPCVFIYLFYINNGRKIQSVLSVAIAFAPYTIFQSLNHLIGVNPFFSTVSNIGIAFSIGIFLLLGLVHLFTQRRAQND